MKIFIDGSLAHTGTTWEDYYRYDPEQSGNNNRVPAETSRLLFRTGGTAVPANAGNGFLVDAVSLSSQAAPGPTGPAGPTGATGATGPGWSRRFLQLDRVEAQDGDRLHQVEYLGRQHRDRGDSGALHRLGRLSLRRHPDARALGTAQSATFAIPRGKSAKVRVHLRARLRQMLSTGGAGVKARAIARTEQPAGSLFKSSHRLRLS